MSITEISETKNKLAFCLEYKNDIHFKLLVLDVAQIQSNLDNTNL